MKQRVVCIESDFHTAPYPAKDDICEVVKVHVHEGKPYYQLEGYNSPYLNVSGELKCWYFAAECFREIDYSTGEIVASWIEEVGFKQVELEEAEKV